MRLALALALAALVSQARAEAITRAADILQDRDAADGRNFCVVGKPVAIDQRFGRATGKHLFRGKLDDGTGRLEIFAFGYFPPVGLGESIEVCGRYNKSKLHKNGLVYSDEIEAAAILKGKGIASGAVEVGESVTPRAKAVASAQAAVPPSPR